MKNNYLILYNPISGNRKSLVIIKKLKIEFDRLNYNYKIIKSEYSGHMIALCAKNLSYKTIIIIGGDGTFNVSQKAFGGSTRRGQWKDLGNGQVELIYDDGGFVRSGDGGSAKVDARATITLLSKSKFQLGSTVYRRY